jgi:hypothetical protein
MAGSDCAPLKPFREVDRDAKQQGRVEAHRQMRTRQPGHTIDIHCSPV